MTYGKVRGTMSDPKRRAVRSFEKQVSMASTVLTTRGCTLRDGISSMLVSRRFWGSRVGTVLARTARREPAIEASSSVVFGLSMPVTAAIPKSHPGGSPVRVRLAPQIGLEPRILVVRVRLAPLQPPAAVN